MDAPAARPYASWIVERGAPSLVHRGETIGECDRTLRAHRFGVVARAGEIVSVKGTDAAALKELRKAIVEDWRRRESEPEAPALPEGVDLGPPKVRSKRRTEEHASGPVPPPPLVPDPIAEPELPVPLEATPTGKATCTRCLRFPVAGLSHKTRPEERTWCAKCRQATCSARLHEARKDALAQRAHAKRIQRPRKVTPRAVRTTEPTSPLAASLDRWEALGAELEEHRELVRLGRAVREVTRG